MELTCQAAPLKAFRHGCLQTTTLSSFHHIPFVPTRTESWTRQSPCTKLNGSTWRRHSGRIERSPSIPECLRISKGLLRRVGWRPSLELATKHQAAPFAAVQESGQLSAESETQSALQQGVSANLEPPSHGPAVPEPSGFGSSKPGSFNSEDLNPEPPNPLLTTAGPESAADEALQMLEWDRICSTVATFASTSSGQQLAAELTLPPTQEESEALLRETAAALALDSSAGGDCLEFGRIDTKAAEYGLYKARKSVPMSGPELRLTAAVLSSSDRLLRGVTTAIRLEERELALQRPINWGDFSEPPPPPTPTLQPLMRLVQAIIPHPEIVKAIDNVVDVTGEVKDSASPELRKARQQVASAEERLKDLLGGFSDRGGKLTMHNDRMCLAVNSAIRDVIPGLLIGSGGNGSLLVEPPAAVSLNNRLAEARRASTAAEDAVRKAITERLTPWLDDVSSAMETLVKADVIVARARCARWLKAARPSFVKVAEEKKEVVREKVKRPEENKYAGLAAQTLDDGTDSETEGDEEGVSDQGVSDGWSGQERDGESSDWENVSEEDEEAEPAPEDEQSSETRPAKRRATETASEYLVRLEQARHPLLVLQHQDALKKAKQKTKSRAAALKRAKTRGMFGVGKAVSLEQLEAALCAAEREEAALGAGAPTPIDVVIRAETRVVAITGPNTGGKTAAIKTLGLAALMAKAGLYVPAREPVVLPWFDAVLCDIGDDQSLTQSLSTFSGHLRRIKRIKAASTARSLVLLDEVGGGTDPTEGAALGMALLQSFAERKSGGSLLTMATTHHGELKTLKYSDPRFENACVEFDEERLAPTFRLLWGIPGRSNALNIAERLGLDARIISEARNLHGEANLEASEAILDLERQRKAYSVAVDESERLLQEARRMQRQLAAADSRLRRHQGPLLLKQATEVEAAAQQAREQVAHLQNVWRGHVAAQERRKREKRERKALEEAARAEEELERRERMREAALSGNAFGALAGLQGLGGKTGGNGVAVSKQKQGVELRGDLPRGNGEVGWEEQQKEGGGYEGNPQGRGTEEDVSGKVGAGNLSGKDGRAASGTRAGPSGNPFGVLREKLQESKPPGTSAPRESKPKLAGGNLPKASKSFDGETLDEEELNRYVESVGGAYGGDDDSSSEDGTVERAVGSEEKAGPSGGAVPLPEGIRTGRGVKKLGARMKKRSSSEVSVPVTSSSALRSPLKVSGNGSGGLQSDGASEKAKRVESSASEAGRMDSAVGEGRVDKHANERTPARVPAQSDGKRPAQRSKAPAGWKGQLAQLKNLQGR